MTYYPTHKRTDPRSGQRYSIRTEQGETLCESTVRNDYGDIVAMAWEPTMLGAAREALRKARACGFYDSREEDAR